MSNESTQGRRPIEQERHQTFRLHRLLIPLAVLSAPARAQETSSQAPAAMDTVGLEEVIVSSRRREELLRDVPVSITAFSSRDIEKGNIKDVTSYFAKTPNVSFTESGSRGERDISIRGVSNIGGQASALAFYVDEFNIVNGPRTANTGNTNSSLNPQLQDVERIEVLRGPQGTFFGRNSTGGAVNVTTKKPTADFHASASAELSRFDTWAVGGVINAPITADTLFMRVSGHREESGGAVENVNPVGGGSDSEFTNARFALRLLPSNRLTVDLSANYTKEEQGGAELVATGVVAANSVGLMRALGLTSAVSDGLGFYPANDGKYNHDLRDQLSNRFVTLVGRLEYDFGPVTLTSVTGYLDTDHVGDSDLDFTSVGYLKQHTEAQSDTFSQELRLSNSARGAFSWTVGALFAEDSLEQDFSVRPGPAGFLGLPENFPIDTGDIHFGTQSLAAFGEVTWHATDRLDLTLGGRYSRDELDQQVAGISFNVPDVPGSGEVSFSDFSPRVAATYRWSDQVTTYATVSRGFKAGGLQLNVTQQLPKVDFDEETLMNYEAGVRLDTLGGRVRINASGFYMKWDDMQVTTNVAVFDSNNQISFVNTTSNAASATSQGVELEVQARPIPALRLLGSVGYLDAKFDEFPNAVIQGGVEDLSGKPIPRAPKWTASADAEYGFGLGEAWDGFVRSEWSYRSQTFPTVDSLVRTGFPYRAPSFSVWNFRVGAQNEKYEVAAYVENAFDKRYFTKTEDFGFAGIRLHPSYRTYGVKFNVHFE